MFLFQISNKQNLWSVDQAQDDDARQVLEAEDEMFEQEQRTRVLTEVRGHCNRALVTVIINNSLY